MLKSIAWFARLIPFVVTLLVPIISGSTEIVPNCSSVKTEPFDLVEPANIVNPILSASDIDDISARFVADPFLFYEDSTWYMFFEVLNNSTNQGDIAVATSKDGFNWNYEQVVLDEIFHLSYPYVFKWQNEYFMIPESYEANSIRLYKATDFPFEWKLESILIEDIEGVDSSIFRFNQKWWMFTMKAGMDGTLFLYYANKLDGPWSEHAMNPIISGDASRARCGGRSFVYDNDRIIRIAQKGDVKYGQQVRAFEVDVLTEDQYLEHEVFESPILTEGTGWNETGMHQFDPWWTGDYWLCAVDGDNNYIWSIGIYVTANDTDKDGTPNYIDQCIYDPEKVKPGLCGCGIADSDLDLDGVLDCFDPDDDDDGLSDKEEQGPFGDDLNYDGNGDGIADRLEANVCTMFDYDGNSYITLEAASENFFRVCEAVNNPSTADAPSNVDFPYGFFRFELEVKALDNSTTITIYNLDGKNINTYYGYGPTPDDNSDHWYEFLNEGGAGAQLLENKIKLSFFDSCKGDCVLKKDQKIIGFGGPGFLSQNTIDNPPDTIDNPPDTIDNPKNANAINNESSGGCFIHELMN